jgi:hypothetical protein
VPLHKLWITSHGKANEKYWCIITKPVEVNRILLQWAEAWVLKNCTFIYVFLLSLMSDSCLSQAENLPFNVSNKTIYLIYSLNNLCLLSLMSYSCLSQAENMPFNVSNKTIYLIYSLNNLCLLSLSLTKKFQSLSC